MTFTMPETTVTRARMVRAYAEALQGLIGDATQQVGDVRGEDGELAMNLGDWDGVPVVTRKRLDEAVRAAFGLPVPAPEERAVEVSTPATVMVWAACPRCAIPQVILMSVHPELLVDDDGSELRVKAKAKGVSHTCGQLPLPAAADADPDGLEQLGAIEAIEELALAVSRGLEELLGAGQAPSIDAIRSWDRAVIDQVDRWASAKRAARSQHPEGCGAGEDDLGCTCGLTAAVPPLPRVLGGEADPEPAAAPDDPALAALEELLRPGETLDAALARLESGPDHLDVMGSDAGQRLLSEINRGRGHAVLVPVPGSQIPYPLRDDDSDPVDDQDIPEAPDDDDSDLLPA
jgi:hypothetical protein